MKSQSPLVVGGGVGRGDGPWLQMTSALYSISKDKCHISKILCLVYMSFQMFCVCFILVYCAFL